jgi:hypothetical protein
MLELTGVQKLNAAVIRQLDGMADNIVSHTFDEKKLTPQTKEIAESARQKLRGIVEGDLAWDRMKSVYARIYTENFTQADVDGVNAFYASEAEQDYAAKTPVVTKRTYGQIQQRIGPIMQKLQDAMKAAKAQAQALGYPGAPVAPVPASPPKSR